MTPSILECPNCRAVLTPPSRFARSIVCEYCGATVQIDPSVVSRARFRAAREAWDDPSAYGYTSWTTLDGAHYAPVRRIAEGDTSTVYLAERARFPSRRVLLKVLRDPADRPRLDHEVEVTGRLQGSHAPGAPELSLRLPEPIAAGELHDLHGGSYGAVLRWPAGFEHTLDDVRAAWPNGIEPVVGPWLWRRILEVLHFVHASHLCHGAVIPQHVLVESGEHGARLAGFSSCDAPGSEVSRTPERHDDVYPAGPRRLSRAADLQMSARCVAFALGGDPVTGRVPEAVPAPFADLVTRVASGDGSRDDPGAAWTLREAVGRAAEDAFGPPGFHPLVMPKND